MCGIGSVAGASGAGAGSAPAAGVVQQAGGDVGGLAGAFASLQAALSSLTQMIQRLFSSAGVAQVDAATGAGLAADSSAQKGAAPQKGSTVQQGVSGVVNPAAKGQFMLGVTAPSLGRFEQTMGRKADIVRFFDRMTTGKTTLSKDQKAAVASGHTLFVSLKPSGTWQDIASGKQDAQLIKYLTSLRDEGGKDVYFAFNHEADGKQNSQRGKGADFAAAWRHVYDLAQKIGATAKSGGNLHFTWTMTGWGFEPAQKGRITPFYPGNDYVDVVGADIYNPGSKSFAEKLQPVIDWMNKQGVDKPVMIPELGTPTNTGAAAQTKWIQDVATQLKTNPNFSRVIGAMYWDSQKDPSSTDFHLADSAVRTYTQVDH